MVNSFTPQQIEEFLREFFDVVGARQYIGARYVPIFGRAGEDTVEWDDGAPYEPLTVVMHLGVSYVSRRYVPRGIQITDTAYWVETYRFNAQVEQYRQEVLGFSDRIDDLRDTMESDYVPFPDSQTYPKYGEEGQVLTTLTNGATMWDDPVHVTSDIAEPLINDWLDDHPEATTTVQDGAITTAKLANGAVTDAKLAQSGGILEKALIRGETINGTVTAPYDDLNTLPANKMTLYQNYPSGSVAHLPITGSTDPLTVLSIKAYGASIDTGVVQLAFYQTISKAFVRASWQYPATFTAWTEITLPSGLMDEITALIEAKSLHKASDAPAGITGTLPSGSPFLDLDTLPVNTFVTYNSPTNAIAHMPSGEESSKNFNILCISTFTALVTARSQIIMFPSTGHVYARTSWGPGNPFSAWRRLDHEGSVIMKASEDNVGITGTLPSGSPFLDLDTLPVNTFVTYNSPTNAIAHMPSGEESSKNFNIMCFSTITALVTGRSQIIMFPQTGNTYTRTSWGPSNTFSPWQKLNLMKDFTDAIEKERPTLLSYGTVIDEPLAIDSNSTLIFFGDSITAGIESYMDGTTISERVGTGYVGYLAQALGCTVTNNGVAATYYTDGSILSKIQSSSLVGDYVFVAAGTNDYGVAASNESAMKTALESTFDYLDANTTAKVVIMLPINRIGSGKNSNGFYLTDYREWIYEKAVEHGYLIIDCDDFFPNKPSSWATHTLLDTLHPTDAGHQLYARRLASVINAYS